MNTGTDVAYALTSALFGRHAMVPWWAWLALLVMIFWGLLIPDGAPKETDPVNGARVTPHAE